MRNILIPLRYSWTGIHRYLFERCRDYYHIAGRARRSTCLLHYCENYEFLCTPRYTEISGLCTFWYINFRVYELFGYANFGYMHFRVYALSVLCYPIKKIWCHRSQMVLVDFSKLHVIWIISIRFQCDFMQFQTLFVMIRNLRLKSRLIRIYVSLLPHWGRKRSFREKISSRY